MDTDRMFTLADRLRALRDEKAEADKRLKEIKEEMDEVDYQLSEVMAGSDIVTLHVPQNDSTNGMINREMIGRMKPGAMLINTARGPIVDSEALAEALQDGRLSGAGVDVFETEPPTPEGHPLVKAPNTLLTPHVAFATVEALERRAEIVFDNLKAWLEGRVLNKIC